MRAAEGDVDYDAVPVAQGRRDAGNEGRQDLAMYASFTLRKGVPVLWYPDRKFFQQGRKIEWGE